MSAIFEKVPRICLENCKMYFSFPPLVCFTATCRSQHVYAQIQHLTLSGIQTQRQVIHAKLH